MKESALTTKIRQYLVARGAYVHKTHGGPNSQGYPDLEGCYRGLFLGLEVKMPGKEKNVTDLQAHQLARINEAGGYGAVISSTAQAHAVLDLLDKRLRKMRNE